MALVKLNNRGVRSATTFGSISALGEMTFIKKITASADSTISFVDGTSDVVLDDTYKEYMFTFKDLHPGTDEVGFRFNLSADSGSNYNVTKTSTQFYAEHDDGDTATALSYWTGGDLAQGTGVQKLGLNIGNDNNQTLSGYLRLFNPSSTVFVKHFMGRVNTEADNDNTSDNFIAGHANTTSAVDAIQFSMSSGNIDAGDICLYGIK